MSHFQTLLMFFTENLPKPGDKCVAVGWGILESDQPVVADTLQEVEVPIITNCSKKFSNASMYVCGGFPEGGKDSCQGKNVLTVC